MNIIVDKKDQSLLLKYKWFIKSNGYVTAKIDGRFILLHRLIMEARSGQEVDHVNRIKTDNRRKNLRFSDRFKQMKNATYKPGRSGIVGVLPHGNHWVVRRRINGVRKHIGCYKTIGEAKEAYELGA